MIRADEMIGFEIGLCGILFERLLRLTYEGQQNHGENAKLLQQNFASFNLYVERRYHFGGRDGDRQSVLRLCRPNRWMAVLSLGLDNSWTTLMLRGR